MSGTPEPHVLDGIRAAVSSMESRLDLKTQLEAYAPNQFHGRESGRPILHIEDVSGIPFVCDIPGVEQYQHRARVRAGSGDVVASVTELTPGYEEYCRDRLGLGSPELLKPLPVDGPMAVARACTGGDAFARLVDCARAGGGMTIHPYMAIDEVWKLAAQLSREAGEPVEVVGPPAPIAWVANDKALFSEIVASTLGSEWVVETHLSRTPKGLAGHLLSLAGRSRRAGLKRTRCASAMGNAVFDTARLLAMGPDSVEAEVASFLAKTQWPGDEDVLVVAWLETDLSPSTQLWIPPRGRGLPRLDGVYEQILAGEEKVFVGSRPSTLPAPLNDTLGFASVLVATALQELGYVGRCSFDLLVVGDVHGDFEVRFTECNGRWGGTSTPMHLVHRVKHGPRPAYRAQDWDHPDLVGLPFAELLARVGDDLYDATTGRGRFVFYNVGPLEGRGKLDVIAFGDSPSAADAAILEDLPRLLGVG